VGNDKIANPEVQIFFQGINGKPIYVLNALLPLVPIPTTVH